MLVTLLVPSAMNGVNSDRGDGNNDTMKMN
jgi:hypothetical protein